MRSGDSKGTSIAWSLFKPILMILGVALFIFIGATFAYTCKPKHLPVTISGYEVKPGDTLVVSYIADSIYLKPKN